MGHFNDQQYYEFMKRAKDQFTPFTPIQLVELFKGRSEIIRKIVTELQSPGRHIILFGDRGVGKTSLANLTGFYAEFRSDRTLVHRCTTTSTFDTICADLLRKIGIHHVPVSKTIECQGTMELDLSAINISLGLTSTEELQALQPFLLTPNLVAEHIADRQLLVILDEYDRVESSATNVAISDLIKHLSDAGASTRLMIVGVSESVETLIGNHPSIARNIAQVHLQRMRPNELRPILVDGFQQLDITYDDSVLDSIIATSDGFPHFAHLLGLKICEVLADRLYESDDPSKKVSEQCLSAALERAIEGTQESLRLAYQKATETVRKKSDGYVQVLEGMAAAEKTEVQINELLTNINGLFGTSFRQQNISNWLGVLVNDRKVLLRPRVGYYKFADPMMRAYVRMIMGEKRLSGDTFYQQLLPFMLVPSPPPPSIPAT